MIATRLLPRRLGHVLGLAAALTFPLTTVVSAQYLGGGTKNAVETQIADLEGMRDKFLALADAFPEDLYDWSPMEGVRSVRDVMALIIAECTQFPSMWGFDKPEWVAEGGFGEELGRLGELSRDELIAEIERSFNHLWNTQRQVPEALLFEPRSSSERRSENLPGF